MTPPRPRWLRLRSSAGLHAPEPGCSSRGGRTVFPLGDQKSGACRLLSLSRSGSRAASQREALLGAEPDRNKIYGSGGVQNTAEFAVQSRFWSRLVLQTLLRPMASFVPAFLLLTLMGATCPSASQSTDSADTMCHDWGEYNEGAVSVLEGEAAWLSCPLFSHPSVYNYSSTQSTGHNLFWYQILDGQDLEQPIRQSSRFSKHRERLWLLPACAEDSGQYICLLRNKSFCSKIAMRLKVFRWDQLTPASNCEPLVAMVPTQSLIPLQEGETLDCPDLKDAASMSDSSPTVTWSHKCNQHPFWNSDRQQRGSSLRFYTMVDQYEGLYYCTVRFQRGSKQLNFTRAINVTAINPTRMSKIPVILHPHTDPVFVKSHSKVTLACQANVPFVMDDPSWEVWWTVDGQTLEKLSDHRFSQSNRVLKNDHKDLTVENTLVIQDFQSEDLQRRFNCSVKNAKGFKSRQALLEAEASLPSVELGCGLGVTLVLMLLLFVVYHVFWLELLLLYRSWFGTDERHTDEKDFDVYISYARSGEEEQFVLSTLRRVLENEFGYSVCIFDRDSLPGGTITDETLSFVARSRRLLVVVSPGYASQGSQALLELKAGLQGMALGGHLRVILLQYKPVQRQDLVRELRKAQVALALVRWQGEKSKELSSRFWKRLRVELPVRRGPCRGEGASSTEVALLRLTSQNSTNSQTGLINTA